MSRSYKRPYASICGRGSAKYDKQMANRGVRRRQNQYIHDLLVDNIDWDEFPFPHKLECSHNNTYSWGRDGSQQLWSAPVWNPYWDMMYGPGESDKWYEDDVRRYEKVQRK